MSDDETRPSADDTSTAHPLEVTLENRLMSQGVYATSLERTDERTRLEYEMVHNVPGVTTHEVSTVVRIVLDVAEEREWEPGTLEAVSRSTDGDRRGTWRVEREWFDRLGDDLSDIEFSDLVLDTITHAEG
ncbi:hypothetical protein [Natronosalvus halobius]|uniref:hypothetical protein n=1 Tax=Natronosalvus halobius TaxID=2953746 RepID=UPI0020A13E89|nr:hypothetical protein [Natronosalvus halobius]USZ72784.1 hypothetical protein NGM15_05610 [Natronosalvus halobius]